MDVRTTRFGVIQIAEDRVITFPRGLLGFPQHTRFCLLEPGEGGGDACFFWLQSLDDPGLAFVVTDPILFVKDYSVPVRPEQMGELGSGFLLATRRCDFFGQNRAQALRQLGLAVDFVTVLMANRHRSLDRRFCGLSKHGSACEARVSAMPPCRGTTAISGR